ncbi:MAG: hypothetical protein EOP50_18175, partial [Sphingobacteriales bacterium]
MFQIFHHTTLSLCLAVFACLPLAARADANRATGYEIYPVPQAIQYTGNGFQITPEIHVAYEDGVDSYTRKRLEEILRDYKLKIAAGGAPKAGQTSVLVGISQSGGAVDSYFRQNVPHDVSFFEKNYDAHLVLAKDNVIAVLGADADSAFYGVTTLKHVFNQLKDGELKEFRIDDFANVKHRGFIEGYYGNPWSNEDRAELMKFGGDYKLNSYFFAPKDDVYHNAK